MTALEIQASRMTEAELQEAVRQMATAFGWLYFHDHDSRGNPEGFPDCVLAKAPRIVLAELKAEKGSLTDKQEDWRRVLRACPAVEYHIWRPSDWLSGRIEEELR